MLNVDLKSVPATDPTLVYRYRDGIYAADLLTAAITGLDFFTWLAEQSGASLGEICKGLGIQERPADVMLTLFTAMGLVSKEGEKFRVSQMGREHLARSSPWYLGPYYASLKDRPVCQDMLRVLQSGKPANWGSFKSEKDWASAMEDDAFAQNFTAAMDCRGVYLAQALAKKVSFGGRKRLLDVAGGSGVYACSLVAHHEGVSATVLEKPPVDRVAEKAIAGRGYSEKVRVAAGDIFKEEFPGGHDVHLISNVLHDWDFPEVELLLGKSFRALEAGGMLMIHDAHINMEKSGPLAVASYSTILMHSTEGKCYSLSELYPILERTGFREFTFVETAADRSVVTAVKAG